MDFWWSVAVARAAIRKPDEVGACSVGPYVWEPTEIRFGAVCDRIVGITRISLVTDGSGLSPSDRHAYLTRVDSAHEINPPQNEKAETRTN